MIFSLLARLAALTAVLAPLVTPLHLPSTEVLTPRVPWKENGLWDHVTKRTDGGYPTSGCNHGPHSRGCWHGDFDIDTDMDLHWPNTGKVVKVREFEDIQG
jgi:hypothetical protein